MPDPDAPALVRAVAYYRHSAQDRQENSIPIQQDQVRAWALEHGVEIIREFCEAGKSGLNSEGRPAFTEMMEEWISKRDDFEYVLCLDVSRWGRLQDIDLSAQFSAICKKHKKQVIYTMIGKPKENDPLYPVYVQFERFRAAQYSRELSDKVWRGCVKIAEQGYLAGGKPPYGLSRLLLDEKREPLHVLEAGQHKGIQNRRVMLTEGPPEQVAVVRRIFEECVEKGYSEYKTAEWLATSNSRQGPPSRFIRLVGLPDSTGGEVEAGEPTVRFVGCGVDADGIAAGRRLTARLNLVPADHDIAGHTSQKTGLLGDQLCMPAHHTNQGNSRKFTCLAQQSFACRAIYRSLLHLFAIVLRWPPRNGFEDTNSERYGQSDWIVWGCLIAKKNQAGPPWQAAQRYFFDSDVNSMLFQLESTPRPIS